MQRIFTDLTLINSLKEKVILVNAYCSNTHMSAQGVPGVIMISREVREFRRHYDTTCEVFNNRVSGLEHAIEKSLADIPDKVCEVLLKHFEINGATAVTTESVRNLIQEMITAPGGFYSSIHSRLDTVLDREINAKNKKK